MVASVYIYIYIYKIYKNYCFPNEFCRKGKKQPTKFHISSFKQQISADTIASFRQKQIKNIKIGGMIRRQNRMNKIKISSLDQQIDFKQIRLKFKSQLSETSESQIFKQLKLRNLFKNKFSFSCI